jgi:hypothetical protein
MVPDLSELRQRAGQGGGNLEARFAAAGEGGGGEDGGDEADSTEQEAARERRRAQAELKASLWRWFDMRVAHTWQAREVCAAAWLS